MKNFILNVKNFFAPIVLGIILSAIVAPVPVFAAPVPCAATIYFQVTPSALNVSDQLNISGWVQSTAYGSASDSGNGLCRIGQNPNDQTPTPGSAVVSIFRVAVSDNSDQLNYAVSQTQTATGFLKTQDISINNSDNTTQYPFSFTVTPQAMAHQAGSSFSMYARVFGVGYNDSSGLVSGVLTNAAPVAITVNGSSNTQPPAGPPGPPVPNPSTSPPPNNTPPVPTPSPNPAPNNTPPPAPSTGSTACDFNTTSTADKICNPLQNGLGDNLRDAVVALIGKFMAFIAVVAVGVLVFAGIRMVVSGGSEEQLTVAKKMATWAIIGLATSMLSYSIIAIIQNTLSNK
jgi:hypothetical protein